MTVFISGGVKNGKSYHAQRIAKKLCRAGEPLYYVATMIPHDAEDEARIARHLCEREGWGFETVECPVGISKCVELADEKGTFLLDSVTALLSNEMFRPDWSVDTDAPERVARELAAFAGSVKNAVFVSDFIYSDALKYDEVTESYRAGLALCDAALAGACDSVIEICAGNAYFHKGEPI